MDLFDAAARKDMQTGSPLANRMRPRALDEFVGQDHIIGPGRLLRRAIRADQLSSIIFYGPPGTGKTTLASIIANTTHSQFITINAVLSGIKEIRAAIDQAQRVRGMHGQRTTLFVDEVHRWNKAQQDALLPHVESGLIILIGATTENPYFEVNKALVSRSRIFQLRPLEEADLRKAMHAAISDSERGFGERLVDISDEAVDHIVRTANGDARTALNALELAVETTEPNSAGAIIIDLSVAEESIQRRAVLYDKEGDVHYDTISAFIKSLRGSDPDAALYWMAKMVYAGEDARFIFRRMTILAAEDVGLADPNALTVVVSCWQAFERLGMPEGRFPLSQAALYLATCPKSNTTMAFFDALKAIGSEADGEVPNHLKDGARDKEGFGHGVGYNYPHAYDDHWVAQQYLPTELQGKTFYKPSKSGYEATIHHDVARRKEAQLAAMMDAEDDVHREILTTSPKDRRKDAWLSRVVGQAGTRLADLRSAVFAAVGLQRHHVVLDLRATTGLLTWEAVRQVPEGGVWGMCPDSKAMQTMRGLASQLPEQDRPHLLSGSAAQLIAQLGETGAPDVRFDAAIGRDALTDLNVETLGDLRAVVAPTGKLFLHQRLLSANQRLYDLLEWQDDALRDVAAAAEDHLYAAQPGADWTTDQLAAALVDAGWNIRTARDDLHVGRRMIVKAMLDRFFAMPTMSGKAMPPTSGKTERGATRPTYASTLFEFGATADQVAGIERHLRRQLQGQAVQWRTGAAFIVAAPAKRP